MGKLAIELIMISVKYSLYRTSGIINSDARVVLECAERLEAGAPVSMRSFTDAHEVTATSIKMNARRTAASAKPVIRRLLDVCENCMAAYSGDWITW